MDLKMDEGHKAVGSGQAHFARSDFKDKHIDVAEVTARTKPWADKQILQEAIPKTNILTWLRSHATPEFIKRHDLAGKPKNVLKRTSYNRLADAYWDFFTPMESLKVLTARSIIDRLRYGHASLISQIPIDLWDILYTVACAHNPKHEEICRSIIVSHQLPVSAAHRNHEAALLEKERKKTEKPTYSYYNYNGWY